MIWISYSNHIISLKPIKNYKKLEFANYELLHKYILNKLLEGYLIG